MKEIMFRAWDKYREEFVNPTSYTALYNYNNDQHTAVTTPHGNNIIIQHYTGLKDATGKEVYEGDIIKSDRLNFKEEVIFYKGAFMSLPLSELVYEEDEYSNLYFMLNGPLKCKVVGNIYESKGL